MSCNNKDKYTSKNGSCCNYCSAGQYLVSECSGTKDSQCATCERGYFTATKNHLSRCQVCRDCSLNNRQREKTACKDTENTVCECLPGFYCSNEECDHCQPVTSCHPGEGVKVQATRTNNTVCAPCGKGTFSNVTDFKSPCSAHTRCEDYGKVLKTQGTQTTDSTCGNFLTSCSWILPAGLWAGLVLTIIVVLLVFILWRAKRRSYRAGDGHDTLVVCSRPAAVEEVIPAPTLTPHQLCHCQETSEVDDCKLSIYKPDDTPVCHTVLDSSDNSPPRTLKSSVSFAETNHVNGSAGYCNSNLLRSHSEPQEDEWCGT